MNSTIFYQKSHNHHKGRISIKLGKKHRACISDEYIAWLHSMFCVKTWQNTFQVIVPCLWQNHVEKLCISYLNVISHVCIRDIGHCPQWTERAGIHMFGRLDGLQQSGWAVWWLPADTHHPMHEAVHGPTYPQRCCLPCLHHCQAISQVFWMQTWWGHPMRPNGQIGTHESKQETFPIRGAMSMLVAKGIPRNVHIRTPAQQILPDHPTQQCGAHVSSMGLIHLL
jgi:hypothetical protein